MPWIRLHRGCHSWQDKMPYSSQVVAASHADQSELLTTMDANSRETGDGGAPIPNLWRWRLWPSWFIGKHLETWTSSLNDAPE